VAPVVYFRCRICGSVAVLARDDGRVIRCETCGFTERAVTGR
jgi:predicted RNA-binding Zn-ribbon protein involved in translation (DUF1610 family)